MTFFADSLSTPAATLMRSRDPSRELSDMGFKAKIVEMMVVHQPRLFSKAFASIP